MIALVCSAVPGTARHGILVLGEVEQRVVVIVVDIGIVGPAPVACGIQSDASVQQVFRIGVP